MKMKRFLTYLAMVVLAAAFVVPASAQQDLGGGKTGITNNLANVVSEHAEWFASGSMPGTGRLKVDTFIAATLNDTTFPITIAGAESVMLEIFGREATGGADSVNVLFQFQVASSKDTTAIWHTLTSSYNLIATTAATGDTQVVILSSPTFDAINDTSAATGLATGTAAVTVVEKGDRALVEASRFLRIRGDPAGEAADSAAVEIIVTKVYPR